MSRVRRRKLSWRRWNYPEEFGATTAQSFMLETFIDLIVVLIVTWMMFLSVCLQTNVLSWFLGNLPPTEAELSCVCTCTTFTIRAAASHGKKTPPISNNSYLQSKHWPDEVLNYPLYVCASWYVGPADSCNTSAGACFHQQLAFSPSQEKHVLIIVIINIL